MASPAQVKRKVPATQASRTGRKLPTLPPETRIREADVTYLFRHCLHDYSYKWEDIGEALNFNHGEIQTIKHNHTIYVALHCLRELLMNWSQWPTDRHREEPTLEKLCGALRSRIVGLGDVADTLYQMRNQLPSLNVQEKSENKPIRRDPLAAGDPLTVGAEAVTHESLHSVIEKESTGMQNELEEEKEELETDVVTLNQKIRVKNEEITYLRKLYSQLGVNIDSFENETEDLKGKIRDYKKERSKMKAELRQKEEEIKLLNIQLSSTNKTLSEVQTKLRNVSLSMKATPTSTTTPPVAVTEYLLKEKDTRIMEAERRARLAENRAREAEEAERRARLAENRAREAERRREIAEGDHLESEKGETKEVAMRQLEAEMVRQQNEHAEQIRLLREQATHAERRFALSSERVSQCERRLQEHESQWVVDRNEIKITGEEIGVGGWASVSVVVFRGIRVAAKTMHNGLLSQHNIQLFKREIEMSTRLRHPNLVQFIGATMEGEMTILMELMPTSLRRELQGGYMAPRIVTSIGLDVARALNYLHLMRPNPLIHRDISSANILLESLPNNRWRAKLSDYGTVNLYGQMQTQAPGNVSYSAPECMDPTQHSPKMDIFSFGVLLVEMLTGEFPAPDEHARLLLQISHHQFLDLIQRCMNVNKDDRPSASDIISALNG